MGKSETNLQFVIFDFGQKWTNIRFGLDSICFIRLDFDTMVLAGPTTGLVSPQALLNSVLNGKVTKREQVLRIR